MKYNPAVSSSRRKSRKAYFTSDSETRHRLLSAHLDKDLRTKYGVRAVPIRKDDEVKIVRGDYKGREGKVLSVYRRKFVIHVDRVTQDTAKGGPAKVGINPSNVVITKLKVDKDRNTLLTRKAAGRKARSSGMNDVDQ
jgi:large subunit ribosomal protein L26e